MISKAYIKKLKREIESSGAFRTKIIQETTAIIRESKHAIFSIHRNNALEAEKSLKDLKTRLAGIIKTASNLGLRNEATLKAAIEEYLEALFFLFAINNKSLPSSFGFQVEASEQLAAISDLTGELSRRAILDVTKGDYKNIKDYKNITEELFGALLSMDLHGSLRQKRDETRRNLRRLEEILYDISLRNKN